MHFSLAHSGDSWAHPMASALSDVIINHFSCLDCRENFKKEIQQFPLEDITDTDSGIIWLWSLHNSGLKSIFDFFLKFEKISDLKHFKN